MKVHSIKTRLILVLILFSIIPLIVVSIGSTQISKNALRKTSNQLTSQIVEQTGYNINKYISDIESTINQFLITNLVKENLVNTYFTGDALSSMKAEKAMNEAIIYSENFDDTILNISLILDSGKIIGNVRSYAKDDLLLVNNLNLTEDYLWITGLGTLKNNVFIAKQFSTTDKGETNIITLVVDINLPVLLSTVNNVSLLEDSSIAILNPDGKLLFSPKDQKDISTYLKKDSIQGNSGSYSYSNELITYFVLDNGWVVLASIPERSLTSQLSTVVYMIILLILLAGIISIIGGSLFARSFAKPIINLMNLMKKAEQGDLTVRTNYQNKNEIGQLCNSFNEMFERISHLIKQTDEAIKQTIISSQTLTASTKESLESFHHLAIYIDEISTGSVTQATHATSCSEAMSSLSESINQIIETSDTIYKNNSGSKELIQHASSSIEYLNDSMSETLSMSNEIKDRMNALSIAQNAVRDLLGLLDNINKQTTLLSLNASIEAARAGEAGKGFAVVAHEVSNLSHESQSSTNTVRHNILDMTNKTKEAYDIIATSNETLLQQGKAVNETYTVFSTLITNLQDIDEKLTTINSQLHLMKDLKDSTEHQIHDIAAVTQQSAALSEQVSAFKLQQEDTFKSISKLSEELNITMNGLEDSIQTFTI